MGELVPQSVKYWNAGEGAFTGSILVDDGGINYISLMVTFTELVLQLAESIANCKTECYFSAFQSKYENRPLNIFTYYYISHRH